jgi:hypothetical protein
MITITTTSLYIILVVCNVISLIIGYWIGNDKNKK